jgi:signal transduction histidine kinase
MSPDPGPPPPSSREPAGTGGRDTDIHELQRDANEQLVLASLRAWDEAEEALGALRRAEEAASTLRQRASELRATAEFRERVIGIVGHDFRSPLGAILLSAELLAERGTLGEVELGLLGRISRSGERMGRMIDQLVDFTRARLGGGFALTLASCDAGAVCRDIAEELRARSAVPVLHSVTGDLRVRWDADRVAEALSNLASNAVDHAAPGTQVVIHAAGEGDTVVVSVTNQGPGIPPEVLPTLWKPFRRADDARASPDHLGLGLYVTREIVQAHGGVIEARSADGSTTFTMRLPRQAAVATPPPPPSGRPL